MINYPYERNHTDAILVYNFIVERNTNDAFF